VASDKGEGGTHADRRQQQPGDGEDGLHLPSLAHDWRKSFSANSAVSGAPVIISLEHEP
jgi:hypothetical protein